MVYLLYFFFIYQDSPAVPWTLQEWQFACSEGILRLSQDNCACTRRWRTWRRREEGWPRWWRRQCWSRPGRRGPGFGEARSTVQKSRSGQGLGTAWNRVPAKVKVFSLFYFLTTHLQFDCEALRMNKWPCLGWLCCPLEFHMIRQTIRCALCSKQDLISGTITHKEFKIFWHCKSPGSCVLSRTEEFRDENEEHEKVEEG